MDARVADVFEIRSNVRRTYMCMYMWPNLPNDATSTVIVLNNSEATYDFCRDGVLYPVTSA